MFDPDSISDVIPKTPLDVALVVGHTKIAALLLRHGGISCICKNKDIDFKLEAAKKEMMYDNEKLFAMHVSDLAKQDVICIPKDIINYILSLSVKLELQN